MIHFRKCISFRHVTGEMACDVPLCARRCAIDYAALRGAQALECLARGRKGVRGMPQRTLKCPLLVAVVVAAAAAAALTT